MKVMYVATKQFSVNHIVFKRIADFFYRNNDLQTFIS